MKIHENALLGHLGCPRLLQAAPWLLRGCPRLPQAAPRLPHTSPMPTPNPKLPPEPLGTAPETPKDTEEGI